MADDFLPQSYELNKTEPIAFPDLGELCRRIDEFYEVSGIKADTAPSQMLRGAMFALRPEYSKNNPDWMAQVAHSLREILYRFDRGKKKRKVAFEQYGSTYNEIKRVQEIGEFDNLITEIAHHNMQGAGKSGLIGGSNSNVVVITREIFENIVFQFGRILFSILRRQTDAHHEIDKIIEQISNDIKIYQIEALINLNSDAHQYFFYKADERWLEWLWINGFLDVIKQKAEDPSRYGYRTPELNYLVRITNKKPKEVTDIILAVPISKDNFNPELIEQFMRICGTLPVQELTRVVPKIHEDGWIALMAPFGHWGFEIEKIFKTLVDAKDYETVLILAEAVLSIKEKKEFDEDSKKILSSNPFYYRYLTEVKVFEYLTSMEGEYVEKGLEIVTKIFAGIVSLGEDTESSEVFPVRDIEALYDVDLFELTLETADRRPHGANIQELVASILVLTGRLTEKHSHESKAMHRMLDNYFKKLPESLLTWRLRLFVYSLCPGVFKDELEKAFIRLFEVMEAGKPYHEIDSGAEYKKALGNTFKIFSDKYQREYIKNVFTYFSSPEQDKIKEGYKKEDGWRILSCISEYLTATERDNCEKVFGKKCDSSFKPEPSIGEIRTGVVISRGPLTQEEFGKLPIAEIVNKLRNDWAPLELRKQNRNDELFNPLNAEGAGDLLRKDMGLRFQDYIHNARQFFEKDVLDQHYTYAFLRGIQEYVRTERTNWKKIDWDNLIEVLLEIQKSGEGTPFGLIARSRDSIDMWLSGWTGVHNAIADVLRELLSETNNQIVIDFPVFRGQILKIISYLLKHPEPVPADEEPGTAKMQMQTPNGEGYIVGDPFTTAINTVRGRAFQVFVLLVQQDSKLLVEADKTVLAADVKELYENVLKNEKTRAIMFMFGHYLPSFYFRDKTWLTGLLPRIFPVEKEARHLYIAAWEGYLANSLYEEIFFDPEFQKYYERGIPLSSQDDPERKYHMELAEGIATHFALAFVVFHDKFNFEQLLFKKFWADENSKERWSEFISFIGQHFISGDNARATEIVVNDPQIKERLKGLWDWIIERFPAGEVKLFIEFGFWIDLDKKIFEPVWLAHRVRKTLARTQGVFNWCPGLTKSIIELAKASATEVLEIVRLCLLEGLVRQKKMQTMFVVTDNEWYVTLKILYENPATRQGAYNLINDLIHEGHSPFWKFKEILKDDIP